MSFDSDDQAVENPLNPLADKFILYIWPGEWGLPSLDPDCLTALCFLKYTHLQHEVVTVKNAWKLFKNEYPKLEYKNQFYVGLDEIIEFIKKQKNIDQSLSDSSYADMFALLNLFKQKFIPAFNLLCWLDDDNTYTVIRRAYGNFVRFPLSMFKLKQMAVRAEDSITCHFRDEYLKLETIKQQVNFDAKECLNVLSSKLGENLFMFENRPCLLDAYLFGYLSVLSQAPFVNSPIKSHFTSCLNLEPLTKRIRRETCPSEKKENKAVEKSDKRVSTLYSWFSISRLLSSKSRPVSPSKRQTKTETNTKTDYEAKEEWEKRKNQIMVIGLGITAMIAYAFAIGLIRIDVIKTDVEYIEKS